MEVTCMPTEHSIDVMAHSENEELASQEGQVNVAHIHTEQMSTTHQYMLQLSMIMASW
jgi:hypothetical protein